MRLLHCAEFVNESLIIIQITDFSLLCISIETADSVDISNRPRKWALSQNRELGDLHLILSSLILACDNFTGKTNTTSKNNKNELLPMPDCMIEVLKGKLAPLYIREAVSACREVASSCIPNIIESLIHITTEAEKFSQHLMEELLRQYNNVSSGELKNLSSLLVEILVRYLPFHRLSFLHNLF